LLEDVRSKYKKRSLFNSTFRGAERDSAVTAPLVGVMGVSSPSHVPGTKHFLEIMYREEMGHQDCPEQSEGGLCIGGEMCTLFGLPKVAS